MLMAKKNPYKFSIGFSNKNPAHRKVVDILNNMETGLADFIATAVLHYLGESESVNTAGATIETLQPLISAIVRQEMEKVMDGHALESVSDNPEVMDLSETALITLDENMARGITSAMEAFRRT